jgi:hypothetical protein
MKMAEQKSPCGCGCLPMKEKEKMTPSTAKMEKEGKKAPKKSK